MEANRPSARARLVEARFGGCIPLLALELAQSRRLSQQGGVQGLQAGDVVEEKLGFGHGVDPQLVI